MKLSYQKGLERAAKKRRRKTLEPNKDKTPKKSVEQNIMYDVVPLADTSVHVLSEILSEKEEFDNFNDFQRKYEAYCRENHVRFVIGNSRSVQSANGRLTANTPRFEDKFVYSNVQYVCKHGQKRPSQSRGLQPKRYHKALSN